MKIISEDACLQWLSARVQEPFEWDRMASTYDHKVTYLIPADAGKKTALARSLSGLLDCSGQGLLWITEWGVFPSSENMALFRGYRRSLGEERSVSEAPGHLFEAGDLQQVECLMDLILYFFWDANIFDASSVWLELSHDEVFSIHAKDHASLRSWEEALSPYDLKEISRTR